MSGTQVCKSFRRHRLVPATVVTSAPPVAWCDYFVRKRLFWPFVSSASSAFYFLKTPVFPLWFLTKPFFSYLLCRFHAAGLTPCRLASRWRSRYSHRVGDVSVSLTSNCSVRWPLVWVA